MADHLERDEVFRTLLNSKEVEPALAHRADAAILAGLAAGKERKKARRKVVRSRVYTSAAACLLLLACLVSIRVSPAFASAVSHIPGMTALVDAIRQENAADQSILDALDHDYMQKIGLSDEHDGLKLTVEGIVADDYRMNLLYSIEGLRPNEEIGSGSLSLTDGDGEMLRVGFGSNGNVIGRADGGKSMEEISILFNKEQPLPDGMGVKVTLRGQEFYVRFPVDRQKFAGHARTVPLDYSLEVEGQKMIFERAVISPLTIRIEARYAESNTMKIFDGGNMKLLDDAGKEWAVPNISSGTDEPNLTIFTFQSSYFRKPQALYLTGSWFRALDKDKQELVVDVEKGKLLKAPDDRVSLLEAKQKADELELQFELVTGRTDDSLNYSLLDSSFIDGDGKRFEGKLKSSRTYMNFDSKKQVITHTLKGGPYKGPLRLKISSYPNDIEQDYRIPIDLSGVWEQVD